MKKINYPVVEETLYQETLDNGLRVTLLPKPDFHKTYSLFTTEYGSIDNKFIPINQKEYCQVPDGIAHFLEHKMFEKEDGDVFHIFGKQGASANAYTSFTRTSYLFSTTDQVVQNLETLLDFVQEPYFTEETVEKEKGIIAQEIQMYQDDPNWRLFFGILNNLYPNHPLHVDIAGTVESIQEITAKDLYTCYETFYHPSNMNLFIVGNIEPNAIMKVIKDNQLKKEFEPSAPIKRDLPSGTEPGIIKESSLTMPISKPKAVLGIKGVTPLPTTEKEQLIYKTAASLLFQLLFGSTSQNQLSMYNEGLIDDSFSYEFNLERDFYFADISTDTKEPERFVKTIEDILLTAKTSPDVTDERLALLKKRLLGKHLQSLNSLEYIANQFSQLTFETVTLFDLTEIIAQIQLADIYQVVDTFFLAENFSHFFMYPEEVKE
ncbi:EF-P 5-aminopentanol modification-associated protein YfmH [Vagococcus humatus]|uniref:Peptidase M16 n=1 Tax=Vagococcus humatus TaxID=1889241 RepID=A0A3R9YWW0_9ENTE|nr:pitrilysin family protein [Vagococcus humatus]RST89238.1 peptidase M16 [Vagococcus humatus]